MRVVAGSDHGGLRLKTELIGKLCEAGVEVEDVGTHDTTSTDYPDYAAQVAERVRAGGADWGLLVCGTGIGMSIAANKVTGIRAAVVSDVFSAEATRRHNNAQVLCLGERVIGPGLAWKIVEAFMAAPFEGGRHQRRVDKITALEGER
ncbi:MAG: ribose 5-phosphate isomerase B [Myxococcota bacterium]|jgi:ribose 5-phosphate isomerase B